MKQPLLSSGMVGWLPVHAVSLAVQQPENRLEPVQGLNHIIIILQNLVFIVWNNVSAYPYISGQCWHFLLEAMTRIQKAWKGWSPAQAVWFCKAAVACFLEFCDLLTADLYNGLNACSVYAADHLKSELFQIKMNFHEDRLQDSEHGNL